MDVDELGCVGPSVVAKPSVQLLPKILNGGIAGIVGVSCVFPLDLVKTRLQSQKGVSKYTGILDCFHKTIAQAGPTHFQQFRSLYQGASVNILLITPEKAIKLVANDVFRHALKKENKSLSNIRGILAGACAGFCQIVITTPMELLKIRMQQATQRVSARKLVLDFLKTDGLRGLYKGLRPTMARDVTFSAIYFPLFAELDSWGPRKKDNSGDAVFWASFLAGLSAGAIASFSVTPLDVIKTRLQSATATDKSIWNAFMSILSTEGPFALFKGAACRTMMVCFETLAVEIDCAPKILFIGGGNMAEAIIDGCIKSGFLKHDHVAVTTKTEASANKWLKKGITQVSTTNSDIINILGSCVIVLAVKPHLRHDVFKDLANARLAGVPLIISLMAGIKTSILEHELAEVGYKRHVLRLMPNTPASISAGSTLLARSHNIQLTKKLAESVGQCTEVDERYYNAAAAISGCGPAWVFMFIESLADGGVSAGVPRSEAMQLAAQTVMGAAKLVLETGEHPGLLKDRVCSPGGTTITGVRKLESAGFRSAVIEAVIAAVDRADQM